MTCSVRAALALSCMAVVALLGAAAPAVSAIEAVGILNDSGQVACYDVADHTIPCDEANAGDESARPQQDARFGRDAAAVMGRLQKIGTGPRGFDFTRICMSGEEEGHGACASPPPVPADLEHPEPNDWACLRDNLTGLTYTLGNPIQVTWDVVSSTAEGSYIERANRSSRCGLGSGWRLPHQREAQSVVDGGRTWPSIVDPAYFPVLGSNTMQSPGFAYWTADPAVWHGMFQWTVAFGGGEAGLQCRELGPPYPCESYPGGITEFAASVLLVNGAWRQASQPDGKTLEGDERWQIREDGLIVTDKATGLVWDRCGWGQTGSSCEGDATIFPRWADAMQVARVANALHYKGYRDWRVPSWRELESLVKLDAFPAFHPTAFPNTLAVNSHSDYWTSTQALALLDWAPTAITVNFFAGLTEVADKVPSYPPGANFPYLAAIRLVRGGAEWDAFDGVSERLFWDDFDGAPSTAASIH